MKFDALEHSDVYLPVNFHLSASVFHRLIRTVFVIVGCQVQTVFFMENHCRQQTWTHP